MSIEYDIPSLLMEIERLNEALVERGLEVYALRDWQRRAGEVINELYTEGRFGAADDLLAEARHE